MVTDNRQNGMDGWIYNGTIRPRAASINEIAGQHFSKIKCYKYKVSVVAFKSDY